MPDPSLTQSDAQESKRQTGVEAALTNLTKLTNPIKKNSLTLCTLDSPFPSRQVSEIESDSLVQDASAPPSQQGRKDQRFSRDRQDPREERDQRYGSVMAVDGSAPPSPGEIQLQNYGQGANGKGLGMGLKNGKKDTEIWVHHEKTCEERATKEMEQVVEEHVPDEDIGDTGEEETEGRSTVGHRQNTM